MYGIDYYTFVGHKVQVDAKLTRLSTLYDGSCYKISVPRNALTSKKHHTPETSTSASYIRMAENLPSTVLYLLPFLFNIF